MKYDIDYKSMSPTKDVFHILYFQVRGQDIIIVFRMRKLLSIVIMSIFVAMIILVILFTMTTMNVKPRHLEKLNFQFKTYHTEHTNLKLLIYDKKNGHLTASL